MAGFREYQPGQVWFYYNPFATKDNEKKRELGAVTCRPVVIVQAAFYPEWNDIVTVVPMTHSDRRSGIPIDTTVLKDGGVVEGGTVLPYLMYSVKTKFLFPMMTSGSNRRRLITLAPEDFEKVLIGVKYHLGFSAEIPDYVANWKSISDYDRRVIVKDIELAISDADAVLKGDDPSSTLFMGHRNLPLRRTRRLDEVPVENHILASMTSFDPVTKRMYDPSRQFNREPLPAIPRDEPPTETQKVKFVTNVQYTDMSVDRFLTAIGANPTMESKHIYEGSKFLGDRQLKQMIGALTKDDIRLIMTLSLQRITECTGIRSTSTVSRLRNQIRQAGLDRDIDLRPPAFTQDPEAAPDPFVYTAQGKPMKSRNRRNQLRYHTLFQLTDEDKLWVLKEEDLTALSVRLKISSANCRQLKIDIATLRPDLAYGVMPLDNVPVEMTDRPEELERATEANTDAVSGDVEPHILYEFWETLSPSEINEIKNTTKKKCDSIAKNFGISKIEARQVRGQVTSLLKKANRGQPKIDSTLVQTAVEKLAAGHYEDMTPEEVMIFCRTDPIDISTAYSKVGSSGIPSKANIRTLKSDFRKAITKPIL